MSVIKDALDALREAGRLVDEVKRTATLISDLATEVRDIDRRLARLEGRWEAAMDFGGRASAHANPRALPPPSGGDGQETGKT
jgi:hypothetical protein